VNDILATLSQLPLSALYLAMATIAAVENIFPPVPADSVVAFGSWLAARGEGSALGAFLVTWLGNVAGAGVMYLVGRRHGAGWMRKRFPKLADEQGEQRLRDLYGKYGITALVVSRFIPGIRALVPPFAGALHLPAAAALGAIAIASAVWYGFISYLAFKAGSDWTQLARLISRSGTVTAIVATALLGVGVVFWFVRHRRAGERG
jgi:membrane protein DedA with SNARE-associated domain